MTSKLPLIILLLSLSACTTMVTEQFADNLGNAILTQGDPEIAAASMPTFLVMMDSLVLNSPDNPAILSTSAALNSAYASAFVEDPLRAQQLSDKSLQHARQAICHEVEEICLHENSDLERFQGALQEVGDDEIGLLYTYGTSWAGWIQTHKDDWDGLAQIPKVAAVMKRVVELDETHEWGRAHLYLGVINSQLPPALGGKPEQGRLHFEKAIELSQENDLIAKVEFARHYARLLFDQELHDQLLNEVLHANPGVARLNLSNALAKQQASALMSTSKEYFED